MSFVLEKVSLDSFYSYNLLGLFKILERNPHIENVHLERMDSCPVSEIENWEHKNGAYLPEDLKNFYLSTNGFRLTWSYKFSDSEILPVGKIEICPIEKLILLTGYTKTSTAEIHIIDCKYQLTLNEESKVFQLVRVDDESKVCLVYLSPNSPPSIWLGDEEPCWYFMANNFTEYFRMAIAHIGLPYWQFCFTPQGVPPWADQILLMDAPHVLNRAPYNIQIKYNIEREQKMKKTRYNVIDQEILQPREEIPMNIVSQLNYQRLPKTR